MAEIIFTEEDLNQVKEQGMRPEDISAQIETFKRGIPYVELQRTCTVGDGINVLKREDLEGLGRIFSQSALSGRAMKFVPASGAASRMFKLLISFNNRYDRIEGKQIAAEAEKNGPDHRAFIQFIRGLKEFAFYDDLKSTMSQNGLDIETLISKDQYKDVLEYILTPKGLDLSKLPKALIKFHEYPGHARTPFEEHLLEAAAYTRDRNNVARVHFTVSLEHDGLIRNHLHKVRSRHEKSGVKYEVSFSTQKVATDTIAVDPDNKPFRDRSGRLLFRPGGHGALLENLNDLKGDLVFVKNIDNVVPDRLKSETVIYKKALGGYLVELQKEIFGYLERLSGKDADRRLIKQIFEFAKHTLFIVPPEGVGQGSREDKINFLLNKLNRPLRVCGIVKNEGEPGGSPFWVEHADKTRSLQILESSQVDMKSGRQKAIWKSSTHFNPVDMVCGVRNYLEKSFNLMDFTDPNTGFISIKSKDGKNLKALERPGLWNGAMANWNTVFVEVPIITFNPVKTILDLLRKEHRPE